MSSVFRGRSGGIAFLFMLLLTAAIVSGQDKAALKRAWRASARGTKVTLELKQAGAKRGYAALAEKAGIAFDLRAYTTQKPDVKTEPTVTVAAQEMLFWEVFEVMSKQAPVEPRGGRLPLTIALRRDDGRRSPHVAFVGPARIRAAEFRMNQEALIALAAAGRVMDQHHHAVGLKFVIDVEPGLHVCRASIRLTRVADNAGKDLLKSVKSPRRRESQLIDNGVCLGAVRHAYFDVPTGNATHLKEVRGRLEMRLAPILEPVKLADLETAGTTVEFVNGKVELTGAEATDKGRVTEQVFRFAVPDGLEHGPTAGMTLAPVLVCRNGVRLRPSKSVYGNRQEFIFSLHPGQVPEHLLLFPPIAAEEKALAFALRDLPLPATRAATATAEAPKGFAPLTQMRGSTLSINAKNKPLKVIAAEVTEKTGNPLQILRGVDDPKTVSVDIVEASFWEVLDRLGSHPDVTFSEPRKASVWAKAEKAPPKCVQVVGSARVSIDQVELLADGRLVYAAENRTGKETFELRLVARARQEPKVKLLRHGMSLESCVVGGLETVRAETSRVLVRRVEDARAQHLETAGKRYATGVLGRIPLDLVPVARNIDLVRFYYFAEIYDTGAVIRLDNPADDRVVKIDDRLTVEWGGKTEKGEYILLISNRDGAFRIRADFLKDKGKCYAKTKSGTMIRPLSIQQSGLKDEPSATVCRIRFPEKLAADAAIILWLPKGFRVYAGYVDFKNVPLPRFAD